MVLPRARFILAALALLGLCSCAEAPPDIPFAESGTSFEELDTKYQLKLEDREKITASNLEVLNQYQLDQIYARLTAGPILDGAYRGSFFFAEGGGPKTISEAIGGVGGSAINIKLDKVSDLGELLWKGKRFYRDSGVLRTSSSMSAWWKRFST